MEKAHLTNNVRLKIMILLLSGIVLIFTAFGWFIGMQTVGVNEFEIEIAGTDSLLLSLDGRRWDTSVSLSKETLDQVSYPNHSNWWAGRGLIPVSSAGEIDPTSSRLIMYEKASLTSSEGGYRLMASKVPNVHDEERSGYVAFDLFVKNFTGSQYIEEYNILDEEEIFLSVDSEVAVSMNGGVEDTGIENSVRVAFAQIGRVHGETTDQNLITGIKCQFDGNGEQTVISGVTGICRTASIWEPNDTKHVDNAINWYNTACKQRIGDDLHDPASFSGTCGEVTNGVSYPTYVIKDEISSSDRVDVYDGAAYNKYELSEKTGAFDFFTDSKKILVGTNRPSLMSLAPNSITKIRVYIYLEGQDIDNYDFASIGRKISVQFGFTKERFEPIDVDYEGPSLELATDRIKPVISLNGPAEITIALGSEYTEQGAEATDNLEGDITDKIIIKNPVDVNAAGEYIITYNVKDFAGNPADEVIRTVIVE